MHVEDVIRKPPAGWPSNRVPLNFHKMHLFLPFSTTLIKDKVENWKNDKKHIAEFHNLLTKMDNRNGLGIPDSNLYNISPVSTYNY